MALYEVGMFIWLNTFCLLSTFVNYGSYTVRVEPLEEASDVFFSNWRHISVAALGGRDWVLITKEGFGRVEIINILKGN